MTDRDIVNAYIMGKKDNGTPTHEHIVPAMRLRDGTTISVQASHTHYCSPRRDLGPWFEFEVGFPSRALEQLLPYAEDASRPTDTVYGCVPVDLLCEVIEQCGGIADVEVPNV